MPDPSRRRRSVLLFLALSLGPGCKKEAAPSDGQPRPATNSLKVGLVTDVGGRGDQSFNDSALRGLELWAGRIPEEAQRSLPASAGRPFAPLRVQTMVLQSKSQEDYEPNLQLLVDQGASLVIAAGFMLQGPLRVVAGRNPKTRFLLIDSFLLDARGQPTTLRNVRAVAFREEQGSFLVGALAGLVTRTGIIGFVGGMELPLIKKFEAGFRAGVKAVNPRAAAALLSSYTGSFDNVSAGKQVGQDLLSKGADVIFHAAGSDGQGTIQAVKEARAAGKVVWAIGVDSDQAHLAPNAVLTSMLKRVDLAVFEGIRSVVEGRFEAGNVSLGLAEDAVRCAPVPVDFPAKAEVLAKVEALRRRVVSGDIAVPSTLEQLSSFKASL